ncbi:hypothetical protein FQR65_LT20290 [Abscondita terminalis]|nr:hypothetical protein FQR65_LT20290 [Abscondita terminalis]
MISKPFTASPLRLVTRTFLPSTVLSQHDLPCRCKHYNANIRHMNWHQLIDDPPVAPVIGLASTTTLYNATFAFVFASQHNDFVAFTKSYPSTTPYRTSGARETIFMSAQAQFTCKRVQIRVPIGSSFAFNKTAALPSNLTRDRPLTTNNLWQYAQQLRYKFRLFSHDHRGARYLWTVTLITSPMLACDVLFNCCVAICIRRPNCAFSRSFSSLVKAAWSLPWSSDAFMIAPIIVRLDEHERGAQRSLAACQSGNVRVPVARPQPSSRTTFCPAEISHVYSAITLYRYPIPDFSSFVSKSSLSGKITDPRSAATFDVHASLHDEPLQFG